MTCIPPAQGSAVALTVVGENVNGYDCANNPIAKARNNKIVFILF
jgi:hypothetical protein